MPKLSLCLMVRDEAANLERAIGSFDGVADEFVVMDTGSADGTPELARTLGAAVHKVPWGDDFAAVRNALFEKATGDWIFHLDADEALLPESKPELLALLLRPEVQGAFVLRQDLWDAQRPDHFTEMAQLRLFRRQGLPRQVGRCHPHFVPPLEAVADETGRQVVGSKVRIRHWGYVAERKHEKLQRGARLMRLELQERPGQLYYLAELARTLYDLGDPEARRILQEAADALELLVQNHHHPGTGGLVLVEAMLALPADELPSRWPHGRLEQTAMRWFANSAPIHWQLARKAFESESFGSALRHLEAVRELMESGTYDQTVSFNPDIFGDELWLNLGACRLRNTDLEGAESCFRRIGRDGPFGEAAAQNLQVLQGIRQAAER